MTSLSSDSSKPSTRRPVKRLIAEFLSINLCVSSSNLCLSNSLSSSSASSTNKSPVDPTISLIKSSVPIAPLAPPSINDLANLSGSSTARVAPSSKNSGIFSFADCNTLNALVPNSLAF